MNNEWTKLENNGIANIIDKKTCIDLDVSLKC